MAVLNRIRTFFFVENRAILFHVMGLALLLSILSFFGVVSFAGMLRFDAWWYTSIVEKGYVYQELEQSNMAFYPLFPLLWKYMQVSYIGISLFNALLFLLSLFIIANVFQLGYKRVLVFASLPSMFFCYMPYSESLFMLTCVLFLAGYRLQKPWLICIGLFAASLTRSVAPIFIVAVIFVELTMAGKHAASMVKRLQLVCMYLCSIALGIFLVAYIQYVDTGKWFYFVEVQKHWGKSLSLPILPFTTWGSNRLMWLDGIALTIGLFAMVFLVNKLYWRIVNKPGAEGYIPEFVFSMVYLCMVTFITVSTSVIDKVSHTTSIYSLNRYVLAVPFLFPLLAHVFSPLFTLKKSLLVLVAVLIFLGFGINHSNPFSIVIIVLYIAIHLFFIHKKLFESYWYILYAINILLQILLFSWFSKGMWVG